MKKIGDILELELNKNSEFFKNAVRLNCARNSLRYVIKAFNIKEIYAPYYTCPFVWQVLKNEKCKIHFYHINKDFFPTQKFPKSAYILYTNYWGICDKNIKKLSKQYKNLIVDNALAFYMKKYGIASFNSPRKFFGVPDGSYLLIDKKLEQNFPYSKSYNNCQHLLKQLDTEDGYNDFCNNEDSLENSPIEYMSKLTQKLLQNIDYKKVKKARIKNFKFLHKHLKHINELSFHITKNDVPMNYPLFIKNENLRKQLKDNNIHIEQYWGKLSPTSTEGKFQKYLLLIPINQNLSKTDMQYIIETIKKCLKN